MRELPNSIISMKLNYILQKFFKKSVKEILALYVSTSMFLA